MNCLLVTKNIRTKKAKNIMRGSVTLQREDKKATYIAEFSGTPYSMGKSKNYYLRKAVLKEIGDTNIVLRGFMDDCLTEWHLTPR